VRSAIVRALADHGHTDLTLTNEWNTPRVLFDQAVACRGCTDKVMIGKDVRYCLNRSCFDDKQAAAMEVKHTDNTESSRNREPAEIEEKQLKREDLIRRKVTTHMHRQLAKRLDEYLQDDSEDARELAHTVCIWSAIHHPGGGSDARNEWQRTKSSCVKDIRGLLGEISAILTDSESAAREIVSRMNWDNIRAISHHVLGTKLVDVWSPDEDYIKIWRKQELADWAHSLGCTQPPGAKGWGNYKLADLQEHISSSQLDHFANHEPARYLYEEADFGFYTTAWQWGQDDDELEDE